MNEGVVVKEVWVAYSTDEMLILGVGEDMEAAQEICQADAGPDDELAWRNRRTGLRGCESQQWGYSVVPFEVMS